MIETSIFMTQCDHFPGLRKMYYCFLDSVEEMSEPRHVNQWRIPSLTLKEGKKLGRIYFLPGEANFNEPAADSEHGDIYNLKASGQILSTDELLTSLLMSLSRKEMLIFVEDEKGNLRVFGNTEKGARIKIGKTTSKISGNVFGYDFSIDFVSDEPAYWYDGEIDEDETGGTLNPDAGPPSLDFEVNDVVEGQVSSSLATGVDLVDGDDVIVVPEDITQVGNKFLVKLPGVTAPPQSGDFLVRFFDIDGTILKQEWVDVGNDATAPADPDIDPTYLVFAEWNQAFTNVQNDIDVGAMYDTIDGKTYLFIRITDTTGLQPTLQLNKATTNLLTIDWGDATSNTSSTAGSQNITKTAAYAAVGDYLVTIEDSGTHSVSTAGYLFGNNATYSRCLFVAYLGENFKLTSIDSFKNHYSLRTISIDKNSGQGLALFWECRSLLHCNVPNGITSMQQWFNLATSLVSVSIPPSVIHFNGTFRNCSSLLSAIITSCISLNLNTPFLGCVSLQKINIPDTVSEIEALTFQSCVSLRTVKMTNSLIIVRASLFNSCNSLISLEFPDTVTSIEATAFTQCIACLEYTFLSTTPPTLANTNAFTGINAACKIYVPDANVAAYKAATNWITYANYIYPLSTKP